MDMLDSMGELQRAVQLTNVTVVDRRDNLKGRGFCSYGGYGVPPGMGEVDVSPQIRSF